MVCATNKNGCDQVSIKLSVVDKPSSPVGPVEIESVDDDLFAVSWKPVENFGGKNLLLTCMSDILFFIIAGGSCLVQ